MIPEVPIISDLTFDEGQHIYKVRGECVPSVTTILAPLVQAYYNGIREDVMNNAADRGTAIHNAIENYIEFGVEDIALQWRGYFDAFLQWLEEKKPTPLATEFRIYHKYMRYAGTADMLCVIDGLSTCIDFKSSSTVIEMLCRPQLEGYVKAFESFGCKFDQKAVVHLKEDGSYKMEIYKANDTGAWEVFGALLTMWGYQQKYKRR